jgi:hypothetical protein
LNRLCVSYVKENACWLFRYICLGQKRICSALEATSKRHYRSMSLAFIGSLDGEQDVCPISLTPPDDLANPVGFDAKRAYECDDLLHWLKQSSRHPLTMAPVHGRFVDILHPLVVNGNAEHVPETRCKLEAAGAVWGKVMDGAVRANMLVFALVLACCFKTWHIVAAALSCAHLSHQTLVAYPVYGRAILLQLMCVGLYILLLSGSPVHAQGAMLIVRLSLDSAKRTRLG